MSSLPPPPPPPPERGPDTRSGVAIGIVVTLVLAAGGLGLNAILVFPGSFIVFPVGLVVIAWLVLRQRVPGYGRGVVWAIGIAAVIFTACTVLVIAALSGI